MKKLEEEEALESKKNQDECVDFKDIIKKSEEERIQRKKMEEQRMKDFISGLQARDEEQKKIRLM